MSVGLNPTKLEIDSNIGDLTRRLFADFRRAGAVKYYLDGLLDADLTTIGYSAGEIATLRSAITVLDNMRKVWEGTLAITPAADQRTFPRRLSGMGDVS